MMLNTDRLVEKLIGALAIGIASSIATHIANVSDSMERMATSMTRLNDKIEFVVQELADTKTEIKSEINDHETRLRAVEKRK